LRSLVLATAAAATLQFTSTSPAVHIACSKRQQTALKGAPMAEKLLHFLQHLDKGTVFIVLVLLVIIFLMFLLIEDVDKFEFMKDDEDDS
jgi:TRAP-type uncharacterized transport system fused permease subunit